MNLRDVLAAPDLSEVTDVATVTAVNSDGSLGVDFGGREVNPVAALDTGWTPSVGLVVACVQLQQSWLVLGPVRSSNAATVPVMSSLAFPFDVLPAASGAVSPLVVNVSDTGSWRPRGPGGWMQSDVYQGAYSTTWGYYRGCYFYGGTAFDALAGTTCTSLTIHLSRKGSGGIAGAESVYLAPHTHASQPSGAPYFPVGARKHLGPAWNGTADIALPVEWGQGLIDGQYAGIGHLYSGTADYAIFNGKAADALTGRLTIVFS